MVSNTINRSMIFRALSIARSKPRHEDRLIKMLVDPSNFAIPRLCSHSNEYPPTSTWSKRSPISPRDRQPRAARYGHLGGEEIAASPACGFRDAAPEFAALAVLADIAADRQILVLAPQRLEQTRGRPEPRIAGPLATGFVEWAGVGSGAGRRERTVSARSGSHLLKLSRSWKFARLGRHCQRFSVCRSGDNQHTKDNETCLTEL
jgi:hypothetical protein